MKPHINNDSTRAGNKVLPAPVKAKNNEVIKVSQDKISPFDITQKLHHLKNRSEVRKFLPDILGRVLARTWIDAEFKEQLIDIKII